MNIKPIKPSGKSESLKEKKKTDASKVDSFTRIFVDNLKETQETDNIEDKEIEDLIELHQQFMASVNHEINNPLCVVRGMAQLIKGEEFAGVKNRIVIDADQILTGIKEFNQRDINAVGRECRNSPLSEIGFRKDLVACYLYKVIAPLTSIINQALDDIEEAMRMGKEGVYSVKVEYDKVKQAFQVIKRQADRIRRIIERLEELLPDDIEVTEYMQELKMINLKNE